MVVGYYLGAGSLIWVFCKCSCDLSKRTTRYCLLFGSALAFRAHGLKYCSLEGCYAEVMESLGNK